MLSFFFSPWWAVLRLIHRLSRSWWDGTQSSLWMPTHSSGFPSFLSVLHCPAALLSEVRFPDKLPQCRLCLRRSPMKRATAPFFSSPPLSPTHVHLPMHTHTHLYLCTQACAYTRRHLCPETYTCVYTNASVFTPTHNTCAHTHMHLCSHTQIHTPLCSHIHLQPPLLPQ